MEKPTAVFIGYMGETLPLFNVIDPDNTTGRHLSTVSLKTLASLNIEPPVYPAYEEGK